MGRGVAPWDQARWDAARQAAIGTIHRDKETGLLTDDGAALYVQRTWRARAIFLKRLDARQVCTRMHFHRAS